MSIKIPSTFVKVSSSLKKITGYLRLMRLANIVTAISDILAGLAISGYLTGQNFMGTNFLPVLLLVLSTIGLYGGGVVFNDVFDAALDSVERPERPIPSGLIKKSHATFFALGLLLTGILAAAFVHTDPYDPTSLLLAAGIAVGALVYDKWAKHHFVLGPLIMGICRGLNLLLGMSIIPGILPQYWYAGLVPLIYIAAITMISRGEVHGGNRKILKLAAAMYGIVAGTIFMVAFLRGNVVVAIPFLLLMALMIYSPLIKAIRHPKAHNIGRSVKAGVLALILMNAAWAASFGNIYLAIVILLLLPLSIWLARLFAVT